MGTLLWIVVALLIAGLLVVNAAWRTRRMLPPPALPEGEAMPTVPVQRLAFRALVAVAALVAGAALVVAWYGPETWWNTDAVRLTVTGLLLGGAGRSAAVQPAREIARSPRGRFLRRA